MSDVPSYVAGHIKRVRADACEMGERYEALFSIVEESQPTGVRFTYYRAVSKGIVEKTESGYIKVQRALVKMRETGRLPYPWIVDSSRWMRKTPSYDGVEDALRDLSASYRRALWADSGVAVEVWCESESVAGVIGSVTDKWDVPLFPIKGQTSISFAHSAAQAYRRDPRDVVIYYVGDRDPAGLEIETSLHEKLLRYSGGRTFHFERLACTMAQVEDLSLLGTKPKKRIYKDAMTGERRPWHGEAFEVEAIDAPVLRQIVEDAITSHIDPEALRLHRIAESSERAGLLALAGRWGQ